VLSDVVGLLRCPHCRHELRLDDRVLRCASGHAFDVARQGYANLLPRLPATGTGDTAAMVAARASFLAKGHYAVFADAVAAAMGDRTQDTAPRPDEPVAEIGAGTGYYLATTLAARAGAGVALDVSVPAARRSARAHARIGSVVADAWTSLPLADSCLGGAVVAFAPRSGGELARVVRPGGRLVVLVPAPDHLRELRAALGLLGVDPQKERRLARSLGTSFEPMSAQALHQQAALGHDDVRDLVLMGPNARHQETGRLDAGIVRLPARVDVTLSGVVHVFRRR
jgi:23S rRNA (guanine745-N1)-methyltransferase